MDASEARTATAASLPSIAAPTVRWNRPEQSSDLLTALGATITDDADLTVALQHWYHLLLMRSTARPVAG